MSDPLESHKNLTSPITIDDFAKVEIRVGKVITAEDIPGSDKLIKLSVDFGTEQRQILSGIKKAYTPESLVGRSFLFITNLAPRDMMGLQSSGMLLAVSDENGLPVLYTFDKEITPGTKAK